MPPMPSLSVIIPNYNHEPALELCISSVQNQAYPGSEIIFVDDCSTDNSLARARATGVKVLTTPRNSGVATARNLGAAAATGEILLFLDSDVALMPGALHRAVQLVLDHPGIGAVCGILEAEPLIRDSLLEECRCLQAYYWRLSSQGAVSFLFTAICAMRAEVFHEVGPFNERLRHTEEVDYGQRMSQRYDIMLTPQVRGRHDDDDRIGPMLRKVFSRGRSRIPLYARRRKFAKGFETASRAWASVLSLLTVVSFGLPVLFGPVWLAASAVLLGASFLCDVGMYRFVAGARGIAFLPAFAAVQFLFNLTVGASIAVGCAQWLLSPRFRALYEPAEQVTFPRVRAGGMRPGS
jgi:glycosyltransferase involved in cell wall biosynthesis